MEKSVVSIIFQRKTRFFKDFQSCAFGLRVDLPGLNLQTAANRRAHGVSRTAI